MQDSAPGEDPDTTSSNLLKCVKGSSVAIGSEQLQNFQQRGTAKHDDQDSTGAAWIGQAE